MTVQKTCFIIAKKAIIPFKTISDITGIALDVRETKNNSTQYTLTWFVKDGFEKSLLQHQIKKAIEHTKISIPPLIWEPIVQENWQAKALKDFPPIKIGQFIITRNDEEITENKIHLRIPAAMAFGSGEHSTTAGCLHLYQKITKDEKTFSKTLDMGAGSGILAIAAAKKDSIPALCVDIDPPSVKIAQENAKNNNVPEFITSICGDGFKDARVQMEAPFNLIFANILADPLIEMAEDLLEVLAKNGITIISGFLTKQRPDVEKAYTNLGLKLVEEYKHNGWHTLAFVK